MRPRPRHGGAWYVVVVLVLATGGCLGEDQSATGGEPLRQDENADSPDTPDSDDGPDSHDSQDTESRAGSHTPRNPPLLLPNLRSLPAEDVQLERTDDGRQLRFAAALANTGEGPLLLTQDDEMECPDGQRHASQIIHRDVDEDGEFDPEQDTEAETIAAGCMLHHPTHEHWHFEASAGYALTRPGETSPITSAEKVSFCLRDSRRLPDERWARMPERYAECDDRDQDQGISIGWADVYDADLPGQALPLPDDLPDGPYCLRLTADPFDRLRETREDDNGSAVAVELVGEEVTREAAAEACAVP